MPSKIVTEERIIKKVTNAINNPKSSLYNLQDALEQIRYKGVRVYGDEYDLWISKAILLHRYDMILEIFKINQNYYKLETQVLRLFIFKKPRYLKQFVESNAFVPTNPSHIIMILGKSDMIIGKSDKFKELEYFFSLPRTGHILTEIRKVVPLENYKFYTFLAAKNPDLQKKQKLTKILLRFWLFTVKRMIPRWKDSLYYPGSGALYLKAYTSFKRNLPFMLTCI
jgi:hypothetical protein